MASFKVPATIPQDLLLISDIVGVPSTPSTPSSPQPLPHTSDNIDSSDSESQNASEDEIEAELLHSNTDATAKEPVSETAHLSQPAVSDSDSDDSDADTSSSDESSPLSGKTTQNQDVDDDEDPLASTGATTYLQTKNEVVDEKINIPEVEEVGSDEVLEKVGEVMNIINKVVIVKGLPSLDANRGSDRALDSDTLLVFDDRKVMGYIYETFGPTSQPLYQVRFNDKFPLNPDVVKIDRPVFHVPARSNFVFLSQLKAQKGSDASNLHDEEPAEDELEFSDDEAEIAHRSRLKRKRAGSRARSVLSSRHGTPSPSQMRDQDLVDDAYLHGNAYDARGPYDFHSETPGPSRPQPIPYDDPYSETYHVPSAPQDSQLDKQHAGPVKFSGPTRHNEVSNRADGHEWRGRGRGRGDHRKHGRGTVMPHRRRMSGQLSSENYSSHSLSTTSAAGQLPDHPQHSVDGQSGNWGYMPFTNQQQQPFQFGGQEYQQHQQHLLQMPFIQPHINPRFATSLGLGVMQTSNYTTQFPSRQNMWNNEWVVPMDAYSENTAGGDTQGAEQ